MFDLANTLSFKDIKFWKKRIPESVHIILVGNKCDIKNRKVSHTMIEDYNNAYKYPYWQISTKSNYNFEEPFLYIARLFDSSLKFIAPPSQIPPIVVV